MREIELKQRFKYWDRIDFYEVKVEWMYDDIFGKEHGRVIDTIYINGYENIEKEVKTWLHLHFPEYSGKIEVDDVNLVSRRYPFIYIDEIRCKILYDIAGDWIAPVKLDKMYESTAYLYFNAEQMTRGQFKKVFSKNIL